MNGSKQINNEEEYGPEQPQTILKVTGDSTHEQTGASSPEYIPV
jgi:hypothetical protein